MVEAVSAEKNCRRCGQPVRANAPHGLCPACLVEAALRGPPQVEATPGAAPLGPGVRTFGDYELIEEIARGGMGVVHKARQLSLNRIVALKMILGGGLAGSAQVQRFRAEAQAVAELRHPDIVAIHEVGEHEGQLYFSMDYIEGRDLDAVILDFGFRNSDFRRSGRWMQTVAEAVHYAHQHGILHRDLKPANIIIDQDDRPHVTDFGLAKRLVVPPSGGHASGVPGATAISDGQPAKAGTTNKTDCDRPASLGLGTGRSPVSAAAVPPDGPLSSAASATPDAPRAGTARGPGPDSPFSIFSSPLTLSGQVLGSPSYLSPEQAEGKRGTVGVASDVYSLGAVLYHLLTGRPPFQGETLTALLRQVIETDPVAPRLLNPSIPRDLETICLKCLEKQPRRRYSSAQELAEELGRFLADQPIRARPVKRAERAWRWCRRNPRLAGALGAVAGCLVLGLTTTTWQMKRAEAGELLALQRAYASDMNLAGRALAEEDIGRVRELLERYRPAGKSEIDLRGWEWQYLWMKSSSQAEFVLCRRQTVVWGLAFTADGQRLVVHEGGGVTLVYDLVSRQPIPGLLQTNGPFQRAFACAGDLVAYQGDPRSPAIRQLCIWDLRSNAVVTRIDCPTKGLRALAYSDGQAIRLWDVTRRRPRGKLLGHRLSVVALAFSPDGHWLASGSSASGTSEAEVLLWDTAKTLHPAPPDDRILTNTGITVFERNATSFLAVTEGIITRFDLDTLRPRESLREYGTNIVSVDLSKDGEWLAYADTNGFVHVRNLRTGLAKAPFRPFPGTRPASGVIQVLAKGRLLAVAPAPPTEIQGVPIWDTESQQQAEPWRSMNFPMNLLHGDGCNTVEDSPDGQILATGHNDGRVILWAWKQPKWCQLKVFKGHPSIVMEVAFSPDGRWLASAASDGALVLYDVLRRAPAGQLRGPESSCLGVRFSPDGRRIASCLIMGSYSVQLWDVATRQHLIDLETPGAKFWVPRFSADGRTLAVMDFAPYVDANFSCFWRVWALADIDEGKGKTEKGQGPRARCRT